MKSFLAVMTAVLLAAPAAWSQDDDAQIEAALKRAISDLQSEMSDLKDELKALQGEKKKSRAGVMKLRRSLGQKPGKAKTKKGIAFGGKPNKQKKKKSKAKRQRIQLHPAIKGQNSQTLFGEIVEELDIEDLGEQLKNLNIEIDGGNLNLRDLTADMGDLKGMISGLAGNVGELGDVRIMINGKNLNLAEIEDLDLEDLGIDIDVDDLAGTIEESIIDNNGMRALLRLANPQPGQNQRKGRFSLAAPHQGAWLRGIVRDDDDDDDDDEDDVEELEDDVEELEDMLKKLHRRVTRIEHAMKKNNTKSSKSKKSTRRRTKKSVFALPSKSASFGFASPKKTNNQTTLFFAPSTSSKSECCPDGVCPQGCCPDCPCCPGQMKAPKAGKHTIHFLSSQAPKASKDAIQFFSTQAPKVDEDTIRFFSTEAPEGLILNSSPKKLKKGGFLLAPAPTKKSKTECPVCPECQRRAKAPKAPSKRRAGLTLARPAGFEFPAEAPKRYRF